MDAKAPSSQKQIRFEDFVRFKYIISTTTMTEEEINATWFSQAEYQQSKLRERTLQDRIDDEYKESLQREEYLHTFGLDSLENKVKRRIRVSEGLMCVFLRQAFQWELQERNEEEIAKLYQTVTVDAAIEAKRRAENVEKGLALESLRDALRAKRLEIQSGRGSLMSQKRRWLTRRNEIEQEDTRAPRNSYKFKTKSKARL
jgi:hypothetical protein